MNRVDISNEIVATITTLACLINSHVKEAKMQQQAENNIIQLRLPVRSSRAILMRKFVNSMNSLQPWQQIQILNSLRDVSKALYDIADECPAMADIINALD